MAERMMIWLIAAGLHHLEAVHGSKFVGRYVGFSIISRSFSLLPVLSAGPATRGLLENTQMLS
jgi:hypothetical protein